MRVPPFDRYDRWLAGFGLFLAGMIAGSALFLGIYQHHFNLLALQNMNLKTELEKLTTDMKSLTNTKNKQQYVGPITVSFDASAQGTLDELTENELRRRVFKDLQVVSGKPVSAIKAAPLVYIKLVDGHIYPAVHDKDYIVQVKTMVVVQSELTVWITAKEFVKH